MFTRTTALLLAASLSLHAAAQITVGPVLNPSNGKRYYRTAPMTWAQANTQAASMGGSLVTIHNAALNEWVRVNVATANGNTTECRIGLNDLTTENRYSWIDGDAAVYFNWSPGEPNNFGNEDTCTMFADNGRWNDFPAATARPALIEVSGPIRVPAEYATIQAAINAAVDGQTIEVAPGSYIGSFDFGYKKLVVRSTQGPAATTIRTTDLANGIIMAGGQGPETILEGFTIVGHTTIPQRQIALLDGQTVRNCRIQGDSFGIVASGTSTISDCVIVSGSLAVAVSPVGRPAEIAVQNCTLIAQVGVWAEGTAVDRYRVDVRNTLIVGISASIQNNATSVINLSNCNTTRGLEPGTGNIAADPRFVNAPGPNGYYDLGDDYRLQADSPCIDAGSNNARRPMMSVVQSLDAVSEPRFIDVANVGVVAGAVVDIGATEFAPVLQSPPLCPVDFNADGFLDFFDYDDFVSAFEIGC